MRPLLVLLLTALAAPAQDRAPVIDPFGVLHGASYQPVQLSFLPNVLSPAGIAPGSIFILKGGYLGPDDLVVGSPPYGLRLPELPGGTEVHVRSLATGQVAQARILHSWTFQVAALLPEDFPLGEAEVQVFYRGLAGQAVPFPVVRSYPGLFSFSQEGSGRAVIQNYESATQLPLNGLTRSARPGQHVILWGTGLGEARTAEVQAFIGDSLYPVDYAGPAPGLPGVDQFNLRLPDDLTSFGCYVRLGLVVGELHGSGASIAIAPEGGACAHPWGLSPERLAEIEAGARATRLRIDLEDGVSDANLPQPFDSAGRSIATGFATSLNEAGLESAARSTGFSSNIIPASRFACGLWTSTTGLAIGGFFPDPGDPIPAPPEPQNPPSRGADAGAPWLLAGPGGQALELPAPEPLPWFNSIGLVGPATRQPGFLAPGQWTLNTPGGSEIGPLEAAVAMPQLPDVTVPSVARRNEDIEITWGPTPPQAFTTASVQLSFRLPADPQQPNRFTSIGFGCPVSLALGRVTIPFPNPEQQPLDGATSADITFRVTSFAPDLTLPGVDRVETGATAHRTWSIPLE